MSDLFISLLCVDTTYKPYRSFSRMDFPALCKESVEQKLALIEKAAKDAHRRAIQKNAGKVPKLHLFLAPEFMFANHEGLIAVLPRKAERLLPDNDRHYDALDRKRDEIARTLWNIARFAYPEGTMTEIRSGIAQMTRGVPGLAVMPGTCFWKKTAFDAPPQMVPSGRSSLLVNPPSRDMTTFLAPGALATKAPSSPVANALNRGIQASVTKDLAFAQSTTAEKVKDGRLAAHDLAALHNTAFISFGGNAAAYQKMFPDPSEYNEVFSLFTPGLHPGDITLAGSRLGIEICADHASGALKENTTANKFDLHVVLSAYVDREPSNFCAKPDGYLAFADSRNPGVTRADEDELEPFFEAELHGGSARIRQFMA